MTVRREFGKWATYVGRWRFVRYDQAWWRLPSFQSYPGWGWSMSWGRREICRVSADLDRDTRAGWIEVGKGDARHGC